jgi:general secretion pathway protein G
MRRNRKPQKGFTLIELLVVLAILALLAGVVGPQVFKALGGAQSRTAKVQIEDLSAAVEMYYLDMGQHPSNLEGLINDPGGAKWNGPYLSKNKVPLDPWGNAYQYKKPGDHGAFDIYSLGADNAAGGSGEDADVNNWE